MPDSLGTYGRDYGEGMKCMDMVRQSGFFMECLSQHLDEQIAETLVNQVKQQLSSLTPAQEGVLKKKL
jgi:hypothetical protein